MAKAQSSAHSQASQTPNTIEKGTNKQHPTLTKGGTLISVLTTEEEVQNHTMQQVGQLPYEFLSVNRSALPTEVSSHQDAPETQLIRLGVQDLPKQKPQLQRGSGTKDGMIAQWLTAWITEGLANQSLTELHLLPKKSEIANYLDVSIGTVQNAIRFVEDEGHVESKQRIGTVIRQANSSQFRLRKQTSKRDKAVEALQHFIVKKQLKTSEPMPSARELAKAIGSAPNTTRLALEFLASKGILSSRGVRGNKVNWYVADITLMDATVLSHPHVGGHTEITSETLIDQIERDLKAMVAQEYQVNDKLPSHLELAERFRVSIKTIHDAMRRLVQQTIVYSKRGRYGTYVSRKPGVVSFFSHEEDAEFFTPVNQADAETALSSNFEGASQVFYNYERIEKALKHYIATSHQPGDKLIAMGELASQLGVSSNTVRKALQQLAQEGYVSLTRGRYGGTFVEKLPPVESEVLQEQAQQLGGVAASHAYTEVTISSQTETSSEASADKPKRLVWMSVNPQSANVYQQHLENQSPETLASRPGRKAAGQPRATKKVYNSVSASLVLLSQPKAQ
jgi:DNA-binding GntR family transcriptional regulator